MPSEPGKRSRRLAAVAGGVVAVSAAVALPALAAPDASDEARPAVEIPSGTTPAISPETVIADWYASATDAEKAQFAYMTATDDERAAFAYMLATPEERIAFSFMLLTPEERDAFITFTTPPPEPEPVVTVSSSGAGSGGGSYGGGYGGGGGYLDCVRGRESGGNYGAVNGSSGAGGAYQFLPSTWNNTAAYAGRPDLVGVSPSQASPADQDAMAQALYQWQGGSPWAGPGC